VDLGLHGSCPALNTRPYSSWLWSVIAEVARSPPNAKEQPSAGPVRRGLHVRFWLRGHLPFPNPCPLSGCRLNQSMQHRRKSLCWGFKLQGPTWSFVELTSHFVQTGL